MNAGSDSDTLALQAADARALAAAQAVSGEGVTKQREVDRRREAQRCALTHLGRVAGLAHVVTCMRAVRSAAAEPVCSGELLEQLRLWLMLQCSSQQDPLALMLTLLSTCSTRFWPCLAHQSYQQLHLRL